MKKVFLAGEGPNDLGGWSGDPAYVDPSVRGAIEALLLQIQPEGWQVCGGVNWKRIRKAKSGESKAAETRNVLGAALQAKEAGADVLVLLRDRDWIPQREKDLATGIRDATARYPQVRIGGGIAIELLESWLLAIGGQAQSEAATDAKTSAANLGLRDTQSKVSHIETCGLGKVAKDAASLRAWIGSVRAALSD